MNPALSHRARARLSVGVTGHRTGNGIYLAHAPAVRRALEQVFHALDEACRAVWLKRGVVGAIELYSLLADGVDQDAADAARVLGWPVIAPLPFGRHLNAALNAEPASEGEARRMLEGRVPHGDLALERLTRLEQQMARSDVIEAPEADEIVATAWLRTLAHPAESDSLKAFDKLVSDRYAHAAETMMRQVGLLIAVWDGRASHAVGGTGHCLRVALERGLPAVWIDPAHASSWRVVRAWDDTLCGSFPAHADQDLKDVVRSLLVTST